MEVTGEVSTPAALNTPAMPHTLPLLGRNFDPLTASDSVGGTPLNLVVHADEDLGDDAQGDLDDAKDR